MATSTKEKSKNTPKDTSYLKSGPIDIVKNRWLYLTISAILLIPGIVFIVLSMLNTPHHSPVRLGIDFTGGTILEYGFSQKVEHQDLSKIRTVFEENGYSGPVIQIQEPRTELLETETKQITENASVEEEKPADLSHLASIVSIRSKQLQKGDHETIETALREQMGEMTLLQKNSIGPTLAGEIMVNGLLALLLAYLLIVGYLSFRFQFDYAICAIVALLHDTLFVFGVFAALGYLYQVEVDSMFVTAILTVIGFSVHDTIVVFDRLRENARVFYSKKLPFAEIANISVNQTLARSINTSITTLLPLGTLYFFGGETTREFVLAIILGVLIGTYSSICVASLVLAWWRERGIPQDAQPTAA